MTWWQWPLAGFALAALFDLALVALLVACHARANRRGPRAEDDPPRQNQN
jgi:hypothetical protein